MISWLVFSVAAIHQTSVDEVIARYDGYMRAAQQLSLRFDVQLLGYPTTGVGTLRWWRPRSQEFDLTWGLRKYEFIQTQAGAIEVDHGVRKYAIYPDLGEMFVPQGISTDQPTLAYPTVLLRSLRALVPPNAKSEVRSTEPGEGEKVDTLVQEFSGEGTHQRFESVVATDGRLLRHRALSETPQGKLDLTWEFRDHKSAAIGPMDTSRLEPPIGYVPTRVAEHPEPIGPGATWKPGKVVASGTGVDVDLASRLRGKRSLVVLVDPTFGPGLASLKRLSELSTALRARRTAVIVIAMGPRLKQAESALPKSVLWDVYGTVEASVQPAGLPFFLVVSPSGQIDSTNMGYSTSSSGRWLADMKSMIEGTEP